MQWVPRSSALASASAFGFASGLASGLAFALALALPLGAMATHHGAHASLRCAPLRLWGHGTQLKVNGGFINAGSQWNMGAPPRLGADRSKLKASHVDRALWSAQGFKGGQPYLGIHLHQAHRGSPTALWHCTGTLMQLGSHLRRLAGNQVHGIKHTSN